MKSLFFLFLLCANAAFAQAPQGFSYQAIANNANGTPVVSGNVKTRISILDNTATGAVVYTETHASTTNAQGLFNLTIGQGTPTVGAFSAINWGVNAKFVKVELDPTGGTNYTTVGTSQLQSVPYALYADKVNPANLTSAVNSISSKQGDKVIVLFTSNNDVYAFADSVGWKYNNFSGTVVDTIKNSDFVGFRTSNNDLYFFSQSTGWKYNNFSGTIAAVYNIKGTTILRTSNNDLYAFSCETGWRYNNFSGTIANVLYTDESIILQTSNNDLYAFSARAGWKYNNFSGSINRVLKN